MNDPMKPIYEAKDILFFDNDDSIEVYIYNDAMTARIGWEQVGHLIEALNRFYYDED